MRRQRANSGRDAPRRSGGSGHLALRRTLTRDGIPATALIELARERVREAELLLGKDHYAGAAYIVGYAVELLLKALISRQRFASRWPVEAVADNLKVHDLEALAKINKTLGINWQTARSWHPYLRYVRLSKVEARDMVRSVADRPDGIAAWLELFLPEDL